MKAKTSRKQRKQMTKLRAVAGHMMAAYHPSTAVVIKRNTKKHTENAIKIKTVTEKMNENQKDIEELVKGQIIFIPATNNEVARIVITPELDKEIRDNIHMDYFLPNRSAA